MFTLWLNNLTTADQVLDYYGTDDNYLLVVYQGHAIKCWEL